MFSVRATWVMSRSHNFKSIRWFAQYFCGLGKWDFAILPFREWWRSLRCTYIFNWNCSDKSAIGSAVVRAFFQVCSARRAVNGLSTLFFFFVSRWQVKVITASKGSVEKALTERGGPEETQKYSFAICLPATGRPRKITRNSWQTKFKVEKIILYRRIIIDIILCVLIFQNYTLRVVQKL